MSSPRIQEELALLRKYFPNVDFVEQGLWFRLPEYSLPPDMPWEPKTTSVAFQAPGGYPGTPPYGIYILEGLIYNGSSPNNYQFPASQQPPFAGKWGILSWSPEDSQWRPTSDVKTGSNLLNFVRSFVDRFRQGA